MAPHHTLQTPSDPAVRTPLADEPLPAPDEEIERLGDAIAELSARIQAAIYELLVLIRQFDERGGWHTGFVSCAH